MNLPTSVRATLQYTVDNGVAPDDYFHEPEPSVKVNPPDTDAREVEIHNAWPHVSARSADREGIELHDFAAHFDQFDETVCRPAGTLSTRLICRRPTGTHRSAR